MGLREIGCLPVIIPFSVDDHCPDEIPVFPIPKRRWSLANRVRARLGDTSGTAQRHIGSTIAAAVRQAIDVHGLDVVLMEETEGWAGFVQEQVPVPIIVVLHGPWTLLGSLQSNHGAKEDGKREAREALGFVRAAGLLAPSRNVLRSIESLVQLGDKPKSIVPNSIFVPSAMPVAAKLDPTDILFVGRFDRNKGADTLLEAFASLASHDPKVCLTFAGPDRGVRREDGSVAHLSDTMQQFSLDISDRITCMGQVEREEVARLRATHAISVIASRYEVFGYTVLEAMAAGQAIVCTDVGGPAEILEHDRTALLVPPDDPVAMASAMARLLNDPELRLKLGSAARAHLEKNFNPAVIAKQTVSFIEQVLASQR